WSGPRRRPRPATPGGPLRRRLTSRTAWAGAESRRVHHYLSGLYRHPDGPAVTEVKVGRGGGRHLGDDRQGARHTHADPVALEVEAVDVGGPDVAGAPFRRDAMEGHGPGMDEHEGRSMDLTGDAKQMAAGQGERAP